MPGVSGPGPYADGLSTVRPGSLRLLGDGAQESAEEADHDEHDDPPRRAHHEGAARRGEVERLTHRDHHRHEHPDRHSQQNEGPEPRHDAEHAQYAGARREPSGPEQLSDVDLGLGLGKDLRTKDVN